jgi:hypothetical protein
MGFLDILYEVRALFRCDAKDERQPRHRKRTPPRRRAGALRQARDRSPSGALTAWTPA